MTETRIIKELRKCFATADYMLSNSFIFDWESDFFCITKSGYTVEVEVKISKSDFKADKKKAQKHLILQNAEKESISINKWGTSLSIKPFAPNKFYYCCPEGMLTTDDIPKYAGLLYYKVETKKDYNDDEWDQHSIITVRTATFLHKNKPDLSKILLSKYYHLYLNCRYEYTMLKRHTDALAQTYSPDHESESNAKYVNELRLWEF